MILSLTVHGVIIALWPTIEKTQLPEPGGQAMTVSLLVQANKQAVQQDEPTQKDPDDTAHETSPPRARAERQPPAITEKFTPPVRQTAQAKPLSGKLSRDEPQPTPVTAARETQQATAPPASASRNSRQLEVVLRKAFNAHFYYPRLAIRRGWQGEVRLGLRIEANGHLSRVRILQGSGHDLLDRAAIKSLNRVELLPAAIALLNGGSMDLVLPIQYQLL